MTTLSSNQFLNALRAEGVVCIVESRDGHTWPDNTSAGDFDPHGIMNHHTAMSAAKVNPRSQVDVLWRGRPGLSGPLAHVGLAATGVAHLVGWNNANHAGNGDLDVLHAVIKESRLPHPRFSNVDGNPHFWGIEVFNDGVGEKYPWQQLEALIKINAAICRASGWTAASSIHHREWTIRKIDMSYNGPLRELIAECLELPPGVWDIRGNYLKKKPLKKKDSPRKQDGLNNVHRALRATKAPRRIRILKKIEGLWKKVK